MPPTHDVRSVLGEQKRRAFGRSFHSTERHGQSLDVHDHGLRRIDGRLVRVRNDNRNGLSHEPDAVDGQQRPSQPPEVCRALGGQVQITCGQDGHDPRQVDRRSDVEVS